MAATPSIANKVKSEDQETVLQRSCGPHAVAAVTDEAAAIVTEPLTPASAHASAPTPAPEQTEAGHGVVGVLDWVAVANCVLIQVMAHRKHTFISC